MSDKNLTALKTLVISMAVVLVVGFVAIIAAVGLKMKDELKSGGAIPANCAGGTLDLKGRGQIIDTSVQGTTLRLALGRPDGNLEMIHVDLCSGKELGSLKINSDMPEMMPPVSALPHSPIPPQSESLPAAE